MKLFVLPAALVAVAFAIAGCGGQTTTDNISLEQIPAAVDGTTVNAKHGDEDPDCGQSGPTVWYRLQQAQKGRLGVAFQAGGDLEATVCAFQKSAGGLMPVRDKKTDSRGRAGFDFDGDAGSLYFLVVSQEPESEAGTFRLNVSPIPQPRNDEREAASSISTPPTTVQGTTVGATADPKDPPCTVDKPTVWYRMTPVEKGTLVVHVRADSGTRASVCALRKMRSHLNGVGAETTDGRGNASLSFVGEAGSTYYIVVSRPTAASGNFSLTVQHPDKPHLPPGSPLRKGTGTGHLDPLMNARDAWAVPMEKGLTYRLTLVTRPKECISMSVYSIRARRFSTGRVAADFSCATTEFFAPGPDGGGTYPVLLTAEGKATRYQLFVSPVEPDDSGPGVALESGTSTKGRVTPADPLDLYRFDVPNTSNVEVQIASKRYVNIEVKNGDGRTVWRPEANESSERQFDTGTYYVAIERGERASTYTLRVYVRFLTTTSLTVDGTTSVTIGPEDAVSLQTTTSPDPGPGVTEVQADFFDVATEKWVFRRLWEVDPGSAISFTPEAVGKWRVRATFQPNDVASYSRTGYVTILVATV